MWFDCTLVYYQQNNTSNTCTDTSDTCMQRWEKIVCINFITKKKIIISLLDVSTTYHTIETIQHSTNNLTQVFPSADYFLAVLLFLAYSAILEMWCDLDQRFSWSLLPAAIQMLVIHKYGLSNDWTACDIFMSTRLSVHVWDSLV